MTVDDKALLAEVLFHVEPREDCVAICRDLLKVKGLPEELHVSLIGLLGMAVSNDDPSLAVSHIRQAVRLGAQHRQTRESALAGLRLLTVLSDIEPPDALSALLTDVRKHVSQLMEPDLRALLHLQAAKLEGRRDSLDHARGHLRKVEGILAEHPNVWLESLLEQYQTVISSLSSEVDEALRHAERCKELSIESGAASSIRAAVCNIAITHLFQGNWSKAVSTFTSALKIHERTNDVNSTVPLLDGLAQTHLLKGDGEACAKLVSKAMDEITRGRLKEDSWQSLGLYETRVRLLLFQEQWYEAAELAKRALELAAKRRDMSIATTLRLLIADAMLHLGDLSEAGSLIGEAQAGNDRLPWGALAEAGLVRAEAYLILGDKGRAVSHLQRSLNTLRISGNASLAADVINRWHRATNGRRDTRRDGSNLDVLFGRPKKIYFRPEATSSFDETPRKRAADAIDVAALLDVGSHPELLGRELFSLLAWGDYVQRQALIAKAPRRPPEILAVQGWTYAEATTLAKGRTKKIQRFELGKTGNRRYVLLFEPSENFAAHDSLRALQKVVSAISIIERHNKDQKSRTALWPEEPAAETPDGVFLAADALETLSMARKIGPTEIPVLITGETGTGKEVLALAVHRASKRAARPFVPFNCNAVSRDMLEAQLFGYRRGAFTGAHQDFRGVIRDAAGGTLFLDEIGELTPEAQPKLLRFLETREVHPLGDSRPVTVDVRVIAATNADLDRFVADGRFREDLFYRLNAFRLRLQPLRERREEIPPLIQYFMRRYCREMHKNPAPLPDETLEYLLLYSWPGNIRQLGNEVRRIVALVDDRGEVTPDLLSPEIRASRRTMAASEPMTLPNRLQVRVDQTLPAAVEEVERHMVTRALEKAGGRMEVAAEMLGISRKGLYLKRQRLGLDREAS